MQPGTSTLWARHTQGALFLEVRKRAKKKKKKEKKAEHAKLDTLEPNDQEEKKYSLLAFANQFFPSKPNYYSFVSQIFKSLRNSRISK